MRTKRVLPPAYLLVSMVLMGVLHFVAPAARVIDYPWNLLGGIPLALGVTLNLVADAAFKKHGTTVKPFEVSSTLVTSGAFRIGRHPMYLGMVLVLLGAAVVMGSLTPFFVVVVFGVLIDLVFVRTEERMLEQEFGAAWLAYKKQVRRWI